MAVALRSGQPPRVEVFEDVASLWQAHREADAILIDMPIGLLGEGPDERLCEREARRRLGPRKSSVFPVPCRQAVYEDSDNAAKAVNSDCMKRSLSCQALAIRQKIRRVDELLRGDARARAVFRELHPELLFWAMTARSPWRTGRRKTRARGSASRSLPRSSGWPFFVMSWRRSGRICVATFRSMMLLMRWRQP